MERLDGAFERDTVRDEGLDVDFALGQQAECFGVLSSVRTLGLWISVLWATPFIRGRGGGELKSALGRM